jgi:hypothetical protein
LALATLLFAVPATADHHIMRIVQVYGGDLSHPDAQYAVLQMCIGGQNVLQNHTVHFFDAAGVEIGSGPVFPSNVPSGASQAKVLIATTSAEIVFGISADLRVPARILAPGGKFCFETGPAIDCVAWGAYDPDPPGPPLDATVGNPYDPTNGLSPGDAIQRDLAIDGGSTTLDCLGDFDDTNDSAADFDPLPPAPGNNAGASGFPNPDLVFVHGFESNALPGGWSSIVP